MDPVSMIVAALTAGLTAGLKETAGNAVKDTYARLKARILDRLGGDDDAKAELHSIEQGADADTTSLADRLRAAGAERDPDLLRAAAELLAHADPTGAQAGKYNVQVTGGKGVVVGDDANITMNFGDGA